MKILFVFPTRERPTRFFECLKNIRERISDRENYKILVKLDDDDLTIEQYLPGISGEDIIVIRGLSKNKVHAINRDIDPDGFDIICVHSDDMHFTQPGFDIHIRDAFKNWKGLVHFPDQMAKEKLITYPMLHVDYYKELGYVYHPDFMSVYADNFQHWQAQQLGKYKYVDIKMIFHKHYIWGLAEKDDLVTRTEDPVNYREDHKTFERLKSEFINTHTVS